MIDLKDCAVYPTIYRYQVCENFLHFSKSNPLNPRNATTPLRSRNILKRLAESGFFCVTNGPHCDKRCTVKPEKAEIKLSIKVQIFMKIEYTCHIVNSKYLDLALFKTLTTALDKYGRPLTNEQRLMSPKNL